MKKLLFSLIGISTFIANAEVRTLQGSERWKTTYFTPNVRTSKGVSSNTTYTVFETSGSSLSGVAQVSAWSARNSSNGVLERWYSINNSNFTINFDFFGVGGVSPAGYMTHNGLSYLLPFRGTLSYGDLGSYVLYPSTDYYYQSTTGYLDISEISGSGKMNRAYSSLFNANITSLNAAIDAITYNLAIRGYVQAP